MEPEQSVVILECHSKPTSLKWKWVIKPCISAGLQILLSAHLLYPGWKKNTRIPTDAVISKGKIIRLYLKQTFNVKSMFMHPWIPEASPSTSWPDCALIHTYTLLYHPIPLLWKHRGSNVSFSPSSSCWICCCPLWCPEIWVFWWADKKFIFYNYQI